MQSLEGHPTTLHQDCIYGMSVSEEALARLGFIKCAQELAAKSLFLPSGQHTGLRLMVPEVREPHIPVRQCPTCLKPAQRLRPGAEAVVLTDMGQGWPPRGHLKDRGDRVHGHSRAWAGPMDLQICHRASWGRCGKIAATQPGLKRKAISSQISSLGQVQVQWWPV